MLETEDNCCSDALEQVRGVGFGAQVENVALDLNVPCHCLLFMSTACFEIELFTFLFLICVILFMFYIFSIQGLYFNFMRLLFLGLKFFNL